MFIYLFIHHTNFCGFFNPLKNAMMMIYTVGLSEIFFDAILTLI